MSTPPSTPEATVAQVTQWLSELTVRQRVILQLKLVDGLIQNDIAKRLGNRSQGQISGELKDVWEALNGKAKRARVSYPLDEALVKSALQAMPKTPEEQRILDGAKRAADEQEASDDAKLQNIKVTTLQPPSSLPTAVPRRRDNRLIVGVLAAIVVTIVVLAIIGALRNPFAATLPLTTGPTQTARVETQEVTVPVIQTVLETVPVPVTRVQTQVVVVTSPPQISNSTGQNLLATSTGTLPVASTAEVVSTSGATTLPSAGSVSISCQIPFGAPSNAKALNPVLGWQPGGSAANTFDQQLYPGELTLTSGPGTSQWLSDDTGPLVFLPFKGNFDARVKVVFSPVQSFQYAGIGVRSTADRQAFLRLVRGVGNAGQRLNAQTNGQEGNDAAYVDDTVYLRIVRRGPIFNRYYSANGENWVDLQPDFVYQLPDDVEIYLVLYSTGNGILARFSDFSVCPQG